MNDRQHEELEYNMVPTVQEIMNIINNKQNGKSTTDIKNEMLKRSGNAMLNMIYPMIKVIWNEEKIPSKWNKGQTTSIWKGKGDREVLENYRGITMSSAYGTIFDTLLDSRIEKIVPMTQAQGGGRKGASTCDHLFLLRAIIDLSIKRKKPTFLTFYDVSKAYDHADNNDMLAIMWDKGLRGKTWRILHNLNKELKTTIKTRYGKTREIDMKIGGRQGSQLTGKLFSKMMDLLSEEVDASSEGVRINKDLLIAILLWVDDVVSTVEGKENQEKILKRIDEFAKRHKLKWGQDKCRIMRVGKHTEETKDWKLGEMPIEKCSTYKYLGDTLTSDGENAKNLETRMIKIKASTISINTIAQNEVMNRIETAVLLELHEKVDIPSLLSNAESYTHTGHTIYLWNTRHQYPSRSKTTDLPTQNP